MNGSVPHRRALRLKHHDYSRSGGYFVTLCTEERKPYFDRQPELLTVVLQRWLQLETRFAEVKLDEFVIMPNHLHGIIFILSDVRQPTAGTGVGTIPELPVQRRKMLLPKVVGYFKMNTARRINEILNRSGKAFWQRNYYEHVIRNEKELKRIREYIRNNPLKWELDRENPDSKNFNLEHDAYWSEIYGRWQEEAGKGLLR